MSRNRLLVVGSILFVLIAVGVRSSAATPNVPPGVKPENWRSISSDVGIAIHSDKGSGYQGPIVGTLMIRDGERWRSVELVPGSPGAVPAR
jgi:hypothetical protein